MKIIHFFRDSEQIFCQNRRKILNIRLRGLGSGVLARAVDDFGEEPEGELAVGQGRRRLLLARDEWPVPIAGDES